MTTFNPQDPAFQVTSDIELDWTHPDRVPAEKEKVMNEANELAKSDIFFHSLLRTYLDFTPTSNGFSSANEQVVFVLGLKALIKGAADLKVKQPEAWGMVTTYLHEVAQEESRAIDLEREKQWKADGMPMDDVPPHILDEWDMEEGAVELAQERFINRCEHSPD